MYPQPAAPEAGSAQPAPITGYTVPRAWGAPGWQLPPRAPGTVIAAAVITYIQAGLGLVGILALLLFAGVTPGLVLAGPFSIVALVAVGMSVLSVVGARRLQQGQSRDLLLWLTIVTIALDIITTTTEFARVTSAGARGAGPSLCSLALPVIVLTLLLNPATAEWIELHRRMPPR